MEELAKLVGASLIGAVVTTLLVLGAFTQRLTRIETKLDPIYEWFMKHRSDTDPPPLFARARD